MHAKGSNTPRRPAHADLSNARAGFVAELARRVSDLEGAMVPLKFDGSSAKAREDVRRRVHALRTGANVLGFLAMGKRLALAEDVLDRAARGGLGPADHAELLSLFRGLAALALSETRCAAEELAPPTSVLVVGGEALAVAADALGLEAVREADPQKATAMARAMAPDVVLLDADTPGARPFFDALLDDPLTCDLPVLVAGTFSSPEASAEFLARGAVRVLGKPVSPDTLRGALAGVGPRGAAAEVAPIGDVTPKELADRLSEEVHRAIVDAATDDARLMRVAMGDGHDVLGALWTSLARVRELLTARSRGAVRFDQGGPLGALLLSTFDDDPRSARGRRHDRATLEGRTVLVADDDPAVTWFFAGIFRAAGCKVLEAHDGEQALGMLWRAPVDLVVCDIVMPGVDGVALTFATKRDVVLHDLPILLVSWREDLAARVRELGAGADGYLMKDASAGVVLARAAEVLRAKSSVETRLAAAAEARGRVDGLSMATLLSLTAARAPSSRLVVRDGVFQFEVDFRDGAPVRACRVAAGGATVTGTQALAGLLGVRAGRFSIVRDDREVTPELTGTLRDQLAPLVSRARAAARLLSAANLFAVGRVEFDALTFEGYLDASPDTLRAIAEKLAAGVSPRELALRGGVPVPVLESLLGDQARRGGVTRVLDAFGEDLLAPRADREAALAASAKGESPLPRLDADSLAALTPSPLAMLPGLAIREASARAPEAEKEAPSEAAEPSSLTPLELPTRPGHVDFGRLVDDVPAMLPPEVDAPSVLDEGDEVPEPPAAVCDADERDVEPARDEPAAFPLINQRGGDSVMPPPMPVEPDPSGEPAVSLAQEASPMPEPVHLDAAPAPAKKRGWGVLALLGLTLAVGSAMFVHRAGIERPSPAGAPPVASPERTPPPPPPAPASAEVSPPYETAELAPGDVVEAGEGMLEIVAGKRDEVSVDKRSLGKGSSRSRIAAGVHEVRAKRNGEEQAMVVHVKAGHVARVDVRAPWKR